ncbi:MAG: hypothetical protein F6K09_24665 [Merismopedia sp. SIO2A8]|nr:hypothetical protein [Merismopedia sp. SIO2A8]
MGAIAFLHRMGMSDRLRTLILEVSQDRLWLRLWAIAPKQLVVRQGL